MKVGYRKPNIKKSIKARTTGKIKRKMKKAVNPLYGKKGMGYVRNPKKAVYNKVYHKTTFGTSDVLKAATKSPSNETTASSKLSTMNANGLNPVVYLLIVIVFGVFGVHKFIDGSVGIGVLYLLTGGLCGVGWLVDIIKAIMILIKSNSQDTEYLLQWQKVIVTDSPEHLIMTKQQLQDATKQQANNDIKIIQDSIKLISDTVKPDVFFSRLDLLKNTANHLQQLEPYININFSVSPTQAFDEVLKVEQEVIYQFIIRYYNSVKTYADTLKTDKGKANQYQKFYDILMNYSDIMNEENIKYIEYKYNQSKN